MGHAIAWRARHCDSYGTDGRLFGKLCRTEAVGGEAGHAGHEGCEGLSLREGLREQLFIKGVIVRKDMGAW